jgi:hypothetical protein
MANVVESISESLLQPELKNELRALIQEEIWKAFDVAIKAAENPPMQQHQLNDPEHRVRGEFQKQAVQQIGKAVRSALNHLKADAQARVFEKSDPERARRIRALADPTF